MGSCFTGEFVRVMKGGLITHRIPTPGPSLHSWRDWTAGLSTS
jgi:hypothetical protein